jgi:hypothetical protein
MTMSNLCVVLPNGKPVSLACYVTSWRAIRALPPTATVTGFDHWPTPAATILRELRHGIHDRINKHDPRYGGGRKWEPIYQLSLARDARRLHDIARRVRVYQIETPELARRFAHLLARHDD